MTLKPFWVEEVSPILEEEGVKEAAEEEVKEEALRYIRGLSSLLEDSLTSIRSTRSPLVVALIGASGAVEEDLLVLQEIRPRAKKGRVLFRTSESAGD